MGNRASVSVQFVKLLKNFAVSVAFVSVKHDTGSLFQEIISGRRNLDVPILMS